MGFFCHKCGAEQVLTSSTSVGRRESCSKCSNDLHACKNCKFYDRTAYNECREPQAERVLDKDNSNFCDYFDFRDGKAGAHAGPSKADNLKKLDDLFKKS